MKAIIMENGLDYILAGDYYFPGLTLPAENRPIGSLGRKHLNYLKEHHPIRFNILVLSGKLQTYLADLNEQAQERLECIIAQMTAAEGVTESMKAHDQLKWVQIMNNIRSRAEEIILSEMIFGEDVG